jgi:spore coat polysaccharide biosynthesis protein SpsF (cytidylyltransferase family)
MSTLAIIQARTTSSRLPGKALLPLAGQPMLARQIERVGRAKRITTQIVATSDAASDDPLAALCQSLNVPCFRGSLEDVLDRFYRAAQTMAGDTIVRLTGDCPLSDPDVIDGAIQFFEQTQTDYASNTLNPTFPDGLDVEVLTRSALEAAWKEATLASEREHVTPFIYKHPERFRLASFEHKQDLSNLRWTVDERQDFEFVAGIYDALYATRPDFSWQDVLSWLDTHPSKARTEGKFQRNAGYQKSLEKDRTV